MNRVPAFIPNAKQGRQEELGRFLASWLMRRYSAVRTLAFLKVGSFTLLLTFLGLGVSFKVASINSSNGTTGPIELVLSGPDIFQTLSAVLCFIFLVSTNLYARWRTTDDERKLLELAAHPNTPPIVRDEIIRRLQG